MNTVIRLIRKDRGYGWGWLPNTDQLELQVELQAHFKLFSAGTGSDESVRVLKKFARKHGVEVTIEDRRSKKGVRFK